MDEIKTVMIEDGKGSYTVINESDFNKKTHKLYKGEGPDPNATPVLNPGAEPEEGGENGGQ